MAARRKSDVEQPEVVGLVVLAPFAYAHAKSGEMVQLTKGSIVDPAKFKQESIDHLVSIDFLAEQK